MFDDDMILATNGPDRERHDVFARLFATLLLAVAGGTLAGTVFSSFSEIENPVLAMKLTYGIRSGVFAALLLMQPISAVIERRRLSQVLAYFSGGFILGISLQFFLLTPAVGPESTILAYFVISTIVLFVWGFGRLAERVMSWLGLPEPIDVGRALLSFVRQFRKTEANVSDLDDLTGQ